MMLKETQLDDIFSSENKEEENKMIWKERSYSSRDKPIEIFGGCCRQYREISSCKYVSYRMNLKPLDEKDFGGWWVFFGRFYTWENVELSNYFVKIFL